MNKSVIGAVLGTASLLLSCSTMPPKPRDCVDVVGDYVARANALEPAKVLPQKDGGAAVVLLAVDGVKALLVVSHYLYWAQYSDLPTKKMGECVHKGNGLMYGVYEVRNVERPRT